jgi:hypothetical protein
LSCSRGEFIVDFNTFQKSIAAGLETIRRINNGIHSDIELLAAQGGRLIPMAWQLFDLDQRTSTRVCQDPVVR